MFLGQVPTLRTSLFGEMGKEIHLNSGENIITKLLRHHMTLGIIYVKNNLLISEGTKIS